MSRHPKTRNPRPNGFVGDDGRLLCPGCGWNANHGTCANCGSEPDVTCWDEQSPEYWRAVWGLT